MAADTVVGGIAPSTVGADGYYGALQQLEQLSGLGLTEAMRTGDLSLLATMMARLRPMSLERVFEAARPSHDARD